MQSNRALYIGDTRHPDFAEPRELLRAHFVDFVEIPSPDDAGAFLQTVASPPHVIVIAQLWPGQFAQRHVEVLHRFAPLARLVSLLSSWCEGETCSGHPWTGVPRLYWHEFWSRFQSERDGVSGWQQASRLPRTATDAERFDRACRPRRTWERGLILISASDCLTFEGLAGGCQQAGYSAMPWQLHSGETAVTAGLWDDSSGSAAQAISLERFVSICAPSPVVAMINFPRQFDVRSALQDGAARVHPKPFCWDDLLAALRILIRPQLERKAVDAA
jgi:hypothetical protein